VAQFRVAGGLMEIESPESSYRNVIVFERDPLIRVAAKRVFGARNMKIAQFGQLDGTREAIAEFFRSTAFFITFLEVTDDSPAVLQFVKRKNPRLPVVMVDRQMDLRRRHQLLHAGADLYLTKPAAARLRADVAEEELNLFAEELALFAERAFAQWADTIGLDTAAGRRFYEEGEKEHTERSFQILKQLINEISDPNDIREVAATILRFSAEYLDRGVVFVVNDDDFSGVGTGAQNPARGPLDSLGSDGIRRGAARQNAPHSGQPRSRGTPRRKGAHRGGGPADHARESNHWYSLWR
jgi:DNA-binding response OmpR family regulator